MAQKKCTSCGESKDELEFSLRFKGGTVRRNQCKTCAAIKAKERREGKIPKKPPVVKTGVTRICRGCSEEKDLAEYDKNSQGKHGTYARCKKCRAAANAAYVRNKVVEERACDEATIPPVRGKAGEMILPQIIAATPISRRR